jgi:hypothetical protein
VTRNGADGKTRKQPTKKPGAWKPASKTTESNWPPKDALASAIEEFIDDVTENHEPRRSALALIDGPKSLTVADINDMDDDIKKMTGWISEATIPSGPEALAALNALVLHADELSIAASAHVEKENGQ